MSDRQETYIYESPDGGDTVYRRPFGSDHVRRELHSISERKQGLIDGLRMSQIWADIHSAAKSDQTLKDMLDQIEIYYSLKNVS